MPQLFRPSANALFRGFLVGAAGLAAGAGLLTWVWFNSAYATRLQVPREQPIPFSHEHHVAGLGLDCRYCHVSVERSASAGMPSTGICLHCHTQIWRDAPLLAPLHRSAASGVPIRWQRVHNLADFVYFNHAAHLAKGIGCAECHGRVDRMPLMAKSSTLLMKWCLECHREPERFVRPRENLFSMETAAGSTPPEEGKKLVETLGVHPRTNCSACHR